MGDVQVERQQLRRRLLAERMGLDRVDRRRMSEQIVQTLTALPLFQQSRTVLVYCSYRSEVETLVLLQRCLEAGKTVCVPQTVPAESRLLAVAIKDPLTDLGPGYLGIPEPQPHLVESREVGADRLEVVVVPGAVFDRNGNRLGYGGGYYDRFLTQDAPQALRFGLAYSGQLVRSVPALPHDVPLDLLVTENEVLTWKRPN